MGDDLEAGSWYRVGRFTTKEGISSAKEASQVEHVSLNDYACAICNAHVPSGECVVIFTKAMICYSYHDAPRYDRRFVRVAHKGCVNA